MNKLIIAGIMATTVVIGGVLAFMPLFNAAAASMNIDVANSNRDRTKLVIVASLSDIPPGDVYATVTITVNGEEVASATKLVNSP